MTLTQADIDLICRPADANSRHFVDDPYSTIYFDKVRGLWLDNGEPLLEGQAAWLEDLARKAGSNGRTEPQNNRSGSHDRVVISEVTQKTNTPHTDQNSDLLQAALAYAARGLYVVPLHEPLFDAVGQPGAAVALHL